MTISRTKPVTRLIMMAMETIPAERTTNAGAEWPAYFAGEASATNSAGLLVLSTGICGHLCYGAQDRT